ncbi:hypothetical protein TUBRATIS_24300 [Tubulinosema ratisbonensis]|uniref:Uncharacterized protein n=1 Tax=Tubulinosema ratisbonensis TaxID=291195 RepID=A0A437AIY3_9MICR|nr:hypothetical protein TUBRATIS_24300 [Tubulinosema ratisbonensis]
MLITLLLKLSLISKYKESKFIKRMISASEDLDSDSEEKKLNSKISFKKTRILLSALRENEIKNNFSSFDKCLKVNEEDFNELGLVFENLMQILNSRFTDESSKIQHKKFLKKLSNLFQYWDKSNKQNEIIGTYLTLLDSQLLFEEIPVKLPIS